MENAKSLDDNYFIKNAIMCWLYHYGDRDHKWDAIYKELAERDTFTQVKPQSRRAKRAPSKTKAEGV